MTPPLTPRRMAERRRRAVTSALVATTVVAAVGASNLFAVAQAAERAPAATAVKAKTEKVLVLLRNQHTNVPATASSLAKRQSLISADQKALLASLRAQGVKGLHTFTTLNGFSATLTSAQAATLSRDSRVASVVPDQKQTAVKPDLAALAAAANGSAASPHITASSSTQKTALCGTKTAPKLEPEALSTTHTLGSVDGTPDAQALSTGKGVTVAFIADGLDTKTADFTRNGKSIVNEVDFTGDPADPSYGAEAEGDASAIGAQGNVVYDISDYDNPATSPVGPHGSGCDIKIVGMAPGANIVSIATDFYTSNIVEGIDYAVSHHVDVLNESFGSNPTPDSGTTDAIQLANDQAVAAGLTVTVSSGDAGTTGTNGSPSTDPNIIAVGASTDNRTYQQTSYAGAVAFSNGTWLDNQISSLSSGGVSQGGKVPDLVAPGEADWAVCSTNASLSPECASAAKGLQNGIQPFGGTSQSAPLTAGAAALVIQAYRDSHKGSSPTPALVKTIITSSALDLGFPAFEQGSGLLDARAAVELARSIPASKNVPAPTAPVGSNLLLSPGQVDITGTPGTVTSVPVTVTNVSSSPQTIIASSRVLSPQSSQTQTVTLAKATEKPYTYFNGAAWVYQKTTFTVPSGADRLTLQGAWQGQANAAGATPVVRFTLIDPTGAFATNSRPQGGGASANYANVDVRKPVAGTWSAYLYTPVTNGYSGPVLIRTATQSDAPGDSVSPTVDFIPAGGSKIVTARVVVPNTGGDTSESITFGTSAGETPTVPVVLRTLIPISKKKGSFSGSITGGNARAQSPTQTNTWAFDVPDSTPSVTVGLDLAQDPNVLIEGVLVSPDGEDVALGTNQSPTDGTLGNNLQLTYNAPPAGRYRFVLIVENPVSGDEISQQYSGSVSFKAIPVQAPALPQGDKIKKGKTLTVAVSVTNPGDAPITVFADPRSTDSGTVALQPAISPNGDLSTNPGAFNEFTVPVFSTSLTEAASSTVPAQIEASGPLFDPDILGADYGTISVATDTAAMVSPGFWSSVVSETLPANAATVSGSTSVTATVQTPYFDTSVDSSTGDPWLSSVEASPGGNSADGGTALVIGPGETKALTVTFTPTAPKGTTVSGTLNLVSYAVSGPYLGVDPFVASSTLAALPYSYTVK